jgi:protocatechuate 3,4-dioxygenase alpha subunit
VAEQAPTDLTPTPGQTIGPFYGYALPYERDHELVPPGSRGAIRLHGTVYDGAGDAIPDALVEVRQAGPDGQVPAVQGSLRRDGMAFTGWGRCAVDPGGHYSFTTVEPGTAAEGAAPFFALTVFARGLLNRLFTRAYVPVGDEALAGDRLLANLPDDRRATLVAEREPNGDLRFDIRLQGDGETVFLAFPRHRD